MPLEHGDVQQSWVPYGVTDIGPLNDQVFLLEAKLLTSRCWYLYACVYNGVSASNDTID